jgi:hypothetical protein
MKRIAAVVALIAGFGPFAFSQALGQHAGTHSGTHVMMSPAELTWNDLPALPGVKIAVLEGPLNEAVPSCSG